jgi:hypothetical protein
MGAWGCRGWCACRGLCRWRCWHDAAAAGGPHLGAARRDACCRTHVTCERTHLGVLIQNVGVQSGGALACMREDEGRGCLGLSEVCICLAGDRGSSALVPQRGAQRVLRLCTATSKGSAGCRASPACGPPAVGRPQGALATRGRGAVTGERVCHALSVVYSCSVIVLVLRAPAGRWRERPSLLLSPLLGSRQPVLAGDAVPGTAPVAAASARCRGSAQAAGGS